jgi:hypothetical protein
MLKKQFIEKLLYLNFINAIKLKELCVNLSLYLL